MNIELKLKKLIEIQNNYSDQKISDFNTPINQQELKNIEKLISEPLNEEFIKLYSFANGQNENGKGALFGEKFLTSTEIIKQLEFSLTLLKPKNNEVENKELSEELQKRIVDFYVNKAPKHKLFGLNKSWHKIEFNCGKSSFGGPYLYINKNIAIKDRELLKIDFNEYKSLLPFINQLHELEKDAHNWDELEFIVYSNGKFHCKRKFYDFDNQITFTSTPENSIKKKYFHYKWIPIFSDYGGNYIGIDLDPDTKGTKGQIINFGRDEENMIVLAKNLEQFLDFLLKETQKPDNEFLKPENHLHEILKTLKLNCA